MEYKFNPDFSLRVCLAPSVVNSTKWPLPICVWNVVIRDIDSNAIIKKTLSIHQLCTWFGRDEGFPFCIVNAQMHFQSPNVDVPAPSLPLSACTLYTIYRKMVLRKGRSGFGLFESECWRTQSQ
jgi:hypothetical protein